jgi:hypothetical protein
MIKLGLTVVALVTAGALPVTHVFKGDQAPRSLEATLLAKANSGPAGKITRKVTCTRTSSVQQTFNCDFDGVRASRIRAAVAVTNGGLSIGWQSVEG